jgi:hypothetical protein
VGNAEAREDGQNGKYGTIDAKKKKSPSKSDRVWEEKCQHRKTLPVENLLHQDELWLRKKATVNGKDLVRPHLP